jgi:ABC-2 type transport system ATP-binding protein
MMANTSATQQAVVPPSPILQSAPARTAAPAVQVSGLRKRYGSIEAVTGLDFEIHEGEIFGLLGPNGAGKTTTISVLATRLHPTAGEARVFGHSVLEDVRHVRQLIGLVPQDIALYPKLTAAENLAFFGRAYSVPSADLGPRVDELLELVGLESRRDDYVDTFSGGMKRRLNLAVGLVHQPRLLLLDEPTVGIDPHSREHIFEIVHALRNDGAAILYTTHYMEEAERLCDRLGIMDEGKIIAMGTLESLLSEAGCSEIIEVRGLPPTADLRGLQSAPGVCRVESSPDVLRVFVNGAANVLGPLQQTLRPYTGVNVAIAPLSLERFFLQLTGKELRD